MNMINADLNKRLVINTNTLPWKPSSTPGIDRRVLEKNDDDSCSRETSIIRYGAGKSFPPHSHSNGKEIYVLEGTFSDEHGDFPVGSYIRNPPHSFHQPYSRYGCTVFVKLQQVFVDENTAIHIDTYQEEWKQGNYAGIDVIKLHSSEHETVELLRYQPNTVLPLSNNNHGEEILVIEGYLQDEKQLYPKGTWIRNPTQNKYPFHSQYGCIIYRKTGHLSH